MPAMFRNYDDEYFTYKDAKEVKERNNQYVVLDGYGNVLGVHLIENIAEMTTDPLLVAQSVSSS